MLMRLGIMAICALGDMAVHESRYITYETQTYRGNAMDASVRLLGIILCPFAVAPKNASSFPARPRGADCARYHRPEV